MADLLPFRIDLERRLVRVRVAGRVTGYDIAATAERITRDAQWDDRLRVLWDERDLTSLEVTPEMLDDMVEAQTATQQGMDLILTAREIDELVMRLYTRRVRGEGRPAQVCTTLACALEALELEELPPAPGW
jgi:hypothetical protein